MFVSRKVKSFEEILRNVDFRFQCRLELSNHELTCSTVNGHYLEDSKFRNQWQKLLNIGITYFFIMYISQLCFHDVNLYID